MAVRIRLTRRGRKKMALYDVVVADQRAPRDGRFIEKLGTYNPNTDPASIELDSEKAFDWVMKGAQPTDTVRAILSYRGIMLRKHLQMGVNKGALTQEEADKKLEAWMADKESKIQGKIDKLAKAKEEKKKEQHEAESKVNKARQEAILAKKKVQDDELKADVAEANADEAEAELAEEGEAAVAEAEASKEEAPKAEEAKEEPKAEEKTETKAEEKAEVKEEAPKEDKKEEEPKAEAEDSKEESKEEEKK